MNGGRQTSGNTAIDLSTFAVSTNSVMCVIDLKLTVVFIIDQSADCHD